MATDVNMRDALECLHEDMARANLAPTWKYISEFITRAPNVTYRPFLWKWGHVYGHLMRAGELITPAWGAERRSMEHVNPDLKSQFATTHTIATAVQLVMAGETAPSHRHQAAAIRFAVKSQGGNVFTRVQGEPLLMEQFDLLLTPSGTWHEHENHTPNDIVWLDGLDYPLVNLMQSSWFEAAGSNDTPPSKPAGYTANRFGHGRPAGWGDYEERVPIMRYPWKDMRQCLERLAREEGSPYDGVMLEYINPLTSGPTLLTLSCRVQELKPKRYYRAHRHASSTVYFVMEGAGYSVINGQRFDWHRGDLFVVPSWSWHEHANPSWQKATLFSITDEPAMVALGMMRMNDYKTGDGHQEVQTTFVAEEIASG